MSGLSESEIWAAERRHVAALVRAQGLRRWRLIALELALQPVVWWVLAVGVATAIITRY